MSSAKKGVIKLPDGWVQCTSKSNPGRKYYFNRRTGKSSWTEPQANEKNDKKHRSKKEKVAREKCKKEELQNRNLKRKSDSHEDQSTSKCKKNKQENVIVGTPQKSKHKKEFHTTRTVPNNLKTISKTLKLPQSVATSTPISTKTVTPEKQQTPAKNLASQRLAHLRSRLSAETQDDNSNSSESPTKKQKVSPKPPPSETKAAKEEKSPNASETKCTATSQSPSSDSVQSIPSPSQFFAANKIISSMKAQLPEEYCDKMKPKDMFADIEQGICNEMSEYPYMKHPATPPQFSEASKLVSAIKSKLNKVSKDANVKIYSSASERMIALRTSLNNESMETNQRENSLVINSDEKIMTEAMDVDCKEIPPIAVSAPLVNCIKDNISSNLVLVVDTNIFLHELDIIKNVLNSNIKGYTEQPTLLVPWRVVNELDRLKDNNNCSGAIWKRARLAMDYLYKSIPENSRIRGQPLRDANSHIYPCESPDDEILNCALQQADRGKSVILLSNDKNLCSKASINGIKHLDLVELKTLLETKLQESDPDLYDNFKRYQDTIYQLLANILENEMRAKYNNLWQHVLFKAPPWTLADVLQCLLKHWIAVFNEVFPRIEHLFKDLNNNLACIENNIFTKNPKSLSESEVTNFKDLCVDIAKKCQIIPEYMELAKLTVERLLRSRSSDECDDKASEMVVIDAFEGVWTVMSSFCAKLSNCLGVSHNIEDKLPGQEPLEVLTSKLALFSNQIQSLTLAIKEVLNPDIIEFSIDEKVNELENSFRDSLQLICMDSTVVNKNNLRIFCTKCRNMLQEAYTKFSQLTELIEVCKNSINIKKDTYYTYF